MDKSRSNFYPLKTEGCIGQGPKEIKRHSIYVLYSFFFVVFFSIERGEGLFILKETRMGSGKIAPSE